MELHKQLRYRRTTATTFIQLEILQGYIAPHENLSDTNNQGGTTKYCYYGKTRNYYEISTTYITCSGFFVSHFI